MNNTVRYIQIGNNAVDIEAFKSSIAVAGTVSTNVFPANLDGFSFPVTPTAATKRNIFLLVTATLTGSAGLSININNVGAQLISSAGSSYTEVTSIQPGLYVLSYRYVSSTSDYWHIFPVIDSAEWQKKILSGTSAPSSSLGVDGDFYIQYQA